MDVTELTIPPDEPNDRVAAMVRDLLTVGDEVTVRRAERTTGDDPGVTGAVTGIEPGYLELDGEPPSGKSVRYDELHTVTRVEATDNPDTGPN